MKKLISLVLAVAMLLSLGSMSAFAASTNTLFNSSAVDAVPPAKGLTDDGEDFDTKWDFEDFTWNSTEETSTYPDISEPVWWVETDAKERTDVAETDRGNSLKFSAPNPNLYLLFGKLIKTGTLHATFYMRQEGTEGSTGFVLGLATGYYDNLAVKKGGEQGDLVRIQNATLATAKAKNNPLTSGAWTNTAANPWTGDNEFAAGVWHRIDYVVTDNATNANGLDVYLDGVKITSTGQIPLTQITYGNVSKTAPGVKGLRFGRFGGTVPDTYLDDVRVRRFSNDEGLTLEPETTTITDNIIKINFTDIVNVSDLTKENITIKRSRGNLLIEDFDFTPVLDYENSSYATGVIITLGDSCYSNDYKINLASSVKGIVTGDAAKEITVSTIAEGAPIVNAESYYNEKNVLLTSKDPFTSFINYVAVGFTNAVDLDSAKEKVSLVDQYGNKVAGSSVSSLMNGGKTVRIGLSKFLDANKTYRVKIDDGLLNADKTASSKGVYLGYEKITIEDAGIKKASHTIAGGKHSYTFYKNDDLAYNLYVIAAQYENGTNKLLDVSFKPVTIGAGEKGTFTNSYPCNFEDGTDVKYYIWDQGTFKPTEFVD